MMTKLLFRILKNVIYIYYIKIYVIYYIKIYVIYYFKIHVIYYTNGEENGNPLQYSSLENPMDRGVWWPIVHGVTRV